MTTADTIAIVASLAAIVSSIAAVLSTRALARTRALVDAPQRDEAVPPLIDLTIRMRYLRALAAIATTLEAMRANFDEATAPVFGNVEPPVPQLADLSSSAARLGRSLDVGILHATMYWLREHCYQRTFGNPSAELFECRARIDAALWETRRLMGIAEDAPLPRTLADVEALAEETRPAAVAAIAAAPAAERGIRRVAARRELRPAPHPTPRAANAH